MPKEILECLLFEVIEVNIEGKWYKVKLPIWSGEFLSKVDLKDISFKDVLWNYGICLAANSVFGPLYEAIHQIKSTNQVYTSSPYEICYANTNAQIDLAENFLFNFGKSTCHTKYYGMISVARCNFSGTHVRIGEEVKAIQILDSSFAKSKIFIPNIGIGRLAIRNSDLSDNDLVHLCIDGLSNNFYGTNFRNSRINVHLDISKLESYLEMDEKHSKKLFIAMFNDYFVGCNVNGNYLSEHEDKEHNLRLILKRER